MSKKSEKEKTKAAVLEKAAQNLSTAPAPDQLPAPDAQGVWNPPPLRPMAKVEEPAPTGSKVDWNGVPRELGDVPTRVLTTKAGVRVDPLPEVTDAVTPAPVEMPLEVFKHSPSTETKVETKRVPNPKSSPFTAKLSGKKPLRKRTHGRYQIYTEGRVKMEKDGESQVLHVLIPNDADEFPSREAACAAALLQANGKPGTVMEVHRLLDRFVLQEVTKTTLVRS